MAIIVLTIWKIVCEESSFHNPVVLEMGSHS